MKYLKMAEGAASLFGKKVTVILESPEGGVLGSYKLDEEKVPESFTKPLIIEVDGIQWRIIAVNVIREKSIMRSRKIILRVVRKDEYENGLRSIIPTLAFPIPELNESITKVGHLPLLLEDWRQLEFLPSQQLLIIQNELKGIENIMSSEISPDPLLGYKGTHIREQIGNTKLDIPVDELCLLLAADISGAVMINGKEVKNSFVIRTENNVYYGIIENEKVRELSIVNFDFVDDEFMKVTSAFSLFFVDWCNASYTFIDQSESGEIPVSDAGDIIGII